MEELILLEEAKATIIRDAETSYPYECCGFMYGNDTNDRVITKAIPVNNVKEENRERRFQIDPVEYIKAEEFADDNDLTLIGIYHSHPEHPAIPSEHDLKRALPFFSYIIASVKGRKVVDILSWRLNDDAQFEEEKVIHETDQINIDNLLSVLNS